ncbi:NAD(+) diphosphatase [Terasakiella sp. A23]|uniref:NAD(+) diphosphatase n=1 Tax=Terasakiella sp. FCG-A23 TaxID=3080561 RepID=UPI002952F2C4|nr:NAD(+) diphosphatase [Terasakiella sp. A23]MDV7340729.1 NAD(+) diphosphatase [Terasakiella sp. A23]
MSFASSELYYSTSLVDRRSIDRPNEEKVHQALVSEYARFVILSESRNLFEIVAGKYLPVFLNFLEVQDYIADHPWAYLGHYDEKHLFVLDATALKDQVFTDEIRPESCFEDLRRAGPLQQRTEASQLAYGRGLMYWHQRHQFCGVCGSPTAMRDAGHVRHCLNPECGVDHFPRTDPAVIMLIHHGDKCLLGHHNRLKEGMYSTLAGFVEPGETLEDAVRREVMEEAGIKVGKVTYAGSQPWPFPTALMVGFYGEAETTDISFLDDELEDAQWFSRDELRNFKEIGKSLPSHDSIARNLIEKWLVD